MHYQSIFRCHTLQSSYQRLCYIKYNVPLTTALIIAINVVEQRVCRHFIIQCLHNNQHNAKYDFPLHMR